MSNFLCFCHFRDLAGVHSNKITNAVGNIYNYKTSTCKTARQKSCGSWEELFKHKHSMQLKHRMWPCALKITITPYISPFHTYQTHNIIQSVIETTQHPINSQIKTSLSGWSARHNKSIPHKRPSADLSSAGCWYTNEHNSSNNDSSSLTSWSLHTLSRKGEARTQKYSYLNSEIEFGEKCYLRKADVVLVEKKGMARAK